MQARRIRSKLVFECRAAFAGIFAFGEDAECLAEILLMETSNLAIAVDGTVVALDQQIGTACDGADFDGSNIQAELGSQAHGKGFVFRRAFESGDGRL